MTRGGLAIFLGAIAGVLAAMQPLSDTDMWWQLATGHETLAHGIVRADVFSWTVRGTQISTDQWLGQVIMYAAYLFGDWRGVALLRVALVIVLVTLVALSAMRRTTRPLAIVLATLPAMLLTRAVWVDRPELWGFVLFAALLLLLRAGRDGRPMYLFAVVPLIGFWANIHGSFALGVVVTVIVCSEGALRDVARRRMYVATALAAVAITLATPAGVGAWTAPGYHFLSPPRDIQEWGLVDIRTPLGIAYVVVLGLVLACAFLGPRVDTRELVLLLPVAFLSLTAARQAPLLAIAAVPLFAERAALLLERWLPRARPAEGRSGFGHVGALSVPVLLVLLAFVLTPGVPDEHAYPREVLDSIPVGDGTLARYEWGGWLIWHGRPVFVDGRLTPYSGGVLSDYTRIMAAAPGWQEAIARRGVRTLLVVPTDPVATRASDLGWRVLARSPGAILIAVP